MATTTETRINSTQAKDAIYKSHSTQSTAEQIDGSVNSTTLLKESISSNGFRENNFIYKMTDILKNDMYLKRGTVIDYCDTSDGYLLSGTGGATLALAQLSNPFLNVDNSIQITTTIEGGSVGVTKTLSQSISLLQSNYVSLYFYNNNSIGISNISLRLRNSSSKYFEYNFRTELFGVNDTEWYHIKIPISDFVANGGILITDDIKEYNFTCFGQTGTTLTFSIGGIEIENEQEPAISFTFDDNNITDYTIAYEKMKQYGFKGTSYIISEAVGTGLDVRMSQLMMDEMYNYGWKFGIHGKDSLNWVDETTIIEAELSIKTCRDWLYNNGFVGVGLTSCAYPQGRYNEDVINVLKKLGITHARTTIPGTINYPIEDTHKIRGIGLGGTFLEKKELIDDAMNKGVHICFIAHTITDKENFDLMIDYIAETYPQYVTTLPEWFEKYTKTINKV